MAKNHHDPKLLCQPGRKAELEITNQQAVLEYIQEFVERGRTRITEGDVLTIHRLTISEIYPCAGSFRTATTKIEITGSRHKPTEPALIPSSVRDMLEWHYSDEGQSRTVFHRAARIMWKICAIHPFNGGNGRVARAIAYLVLVSEAAPLFAGEPLPLKLKVRKSAYLTALKAADGGGRKYLEQMESLVFECVLEQMDDVAKELGRDTKGHDRLSEGEEKTLGAFTRLAGGLVDFVKGTKRR